MSYVLTVAVTVLITLRIICSTANMCDACMRDAIVKLSWISVTAVVLSSLVLLGVI